ncbi:MAG: BamA/TamA family outer membrane protein, partial [Blastocatellia bacterium]
FYLGGEQDIRGYDIRSISPLVPVTETFSTQNVFATDLSGNVLKVRPPNHSTPDSVAPDVLTQNIKTNEPLPLQPGQVFPQFPLGSDSELLFNAEYRIPIIGPVALVPFFDIGSAFNLNRYADDFITSDFAPSTSPLATLILDPRGEIATTREINHARTPETPPGALPPGFRAVFIQGDQQTSEQILLSQTHAGIFQNYRISTGIEIRVQVPVVNVPFRLIFALNPNAYTANPFVLEKKATIRFSVGRTF